MLSGNADGKSKKDNQIATGDDYQHLDEVADRLLRPGTNHDIDNTRVYLELYQAGGLKQRGDIIIQSLQDDIETLTTKLHDSDAENVRLKEALKDAKERETQLKNDLAVAKTPFSVFEENGAYCFHGHFDRRLAKSTVVKALISLGLSGFGLLVVRFFLGA